MAGGSRVLYTTNGASHSEKAANECDPPDRRYASTLRARLIFAHAFHDQPCSPAAVVALCYSATLPPVRTSTRHGKEIGQFSREFIANCATLVYATGMKKQTIILLGCVLVTIGWAAYWPIVRFAFNGEVEKSGHFGDTFVRSILSSQVWRSLLFWPHSSNSRARLRRQNEMWRTIVG